MTDPRINPLGTKSKELQPNELEQLMRIMAAHDEKLSESMLAEQKARWVSIEKAITTGRFVSVPNGKDAGVAMKKAISECPDPRDANATITAGPTRESQRLIVFQRGIDPDYFFHRDIYTQLTTLRNDAVREFLRQVKTR